MFALKLSSRLLRQSFKPSYIRLFSDMTPKYALYQWGQTGFFSGRNAKNNVPTPIPGFDKAVRCLSIGASHCAAITSDGLLYTWGENGSYQCGLGHTDMVTSPELVSTLKDFDLVEVECGDQHTAALSKEGYLFTWGYGGSLFSCGSLGHGDKANQATPVVVDYFYDNGIAIKHISSGSAFMLALDENGDLYSWGRGSFGSLATGRGSDELAPVKSEFKSIFGKIIDCACGGTGCLMITEDRKLYSWGRDDDSQLGHGLNMSGDSNTYYLTPTPVELPENEVPMKIAMGAGSAAVICESGNVYWWGMKLHPTPYQEVIMGGDGDNQILQKLKAVSCGGHMIDVITDNNCLYTWGDIHRQPYGIETNEALVATPVKKVNNAGKVYDVCAGQTMALAAIELFE